MVSPGTDEATLTNHTEGRFLVAAWNLDGELVGHQYRSLVMQNSFTSTSISAVMNSGVSRPVTGETLVMFTP
jgi:hypothetical protein